MDPSNYQNQAVAILWVALCFTTLWLGLSLNKLTQSPYLTSGVREFCADYALPVSVLAMTLIYKKFISDIEFTKFSTENRFTWKLYSVGDLSSSGHSWALLLGFCMSLLFFMDQGFGEALTNQPKHRLTKPGGYHFDLFLVGVINFILTLLGLPWVHGALPHSPLHVTALAEIEESVEDGFVCNQIVKVQEQRWSSFISHLMIGGSIKLVDSYHFLAKKKCCSF